MRVLFGSAGVLFLLAGCTDYGPGQVAPPNAITVQSAFDDVANGLLDFRNKIDAPDPVTGQPHKLGVVVCRIIVHFNISASASQKSGGGATLAVPIEAFKVSANYQVSEAAAAARGNAVLVDLGGVNNDLCSAYEKQSDMYPPPAAASQKGDQSNTQGQNKNEEAGGTGQNQNQNQTQRKQTGHGGNTGHAGPGEQVMQMSAYLKMLHQKCAKGDKDACKEIEGFVTYQKTIGHTHVDVSGQS